MKRLSLKARLTLLYTGLMIVLFVIISALLFSLGSQAILTDTRSLLEERVSSSFDLVEYRHDRLEFDSDLLQVEDGVYLSVYDTEGELLYGRLPYHFTYDLPFEQDALRRIDTDDFSYYVLDMSFQADGRIDLRMRGVISITDAERNFRFILRLAFILFPLFILLSAIVGYLMSRRALAPVSKITATVRDIQKEKDLSRRVKLGKGRDEIYTLAATFDEMLDKIEAAVKRERQFTSDVSHELRTPLSVLTMQCETMLARDDLDAQTRKQVELLQQKIHSLNVMIAQLLQLSRADQGREQLHMETFSFSELCESIAEEYSELAAEAHIHLTATIEEDLIVHADQTLMIRLLTNLLQNAVTYGREHGHIWLRICRQEQLCIEVRDDGIGIREEQLPHIWERFYQADPSRNKGSGLGLSMVRWIVHAHKGEIRVQSEWHKGTSFFCQLPILTCLKPESPDRNQSNKEESP